MKSTSPANGALVLEDVIVTLREVVYNVSIEIAKEDNRGRTRDGLESSAVLNYGPPARTTDKFGFFSLFGILIGLRVVEEPLSGD